MATYGVNVPPGIPVKSLDEVRRGAADGARVQGCPRATLPSPG